MIRPWLTLFGAFAAGFSLGGGIVWFHIGQPAAPVGSAPSVGRGESATSHSTESLATPVGPAPSGMAAESGPGSDPAAEARQLLTETFETIPSIKSDEHQAAVVSLIHRLRGLGPAGFQAIRHFLVSGQDVGLTEYRIRTASHSFGLSTLRKALIHSLTDWPDSAAATTLSRQILDDTATIEEAVLAIRTLEKCAPGVYRDESLHALRDMMSGSPISAPRDVQEVIETAAHFQATEFMPQLERLLHQSPSLVNDYFGALAAFPDADRQAAVARVLADPKVASEIASNPTALKQLDLTDAMMRSHITQVFGTLTPSKREAYLEHFGENARFSWGFSLLSNGSRGTGPEQLRLEQSAKLQLIDSIAPFATTAVLQQRLAEARMQLLEALQH